MRRVAFVALLAGGCLLAPAARALEIGQAAPAFSLARADGATLELPSLRGRVVLVDFWASWCAPCRQSFPVLDAMQKRYADAGLVVVGVNVDTERAQAERFLAAVPVSFAIVYDPEGATPQAFGVRAMPSSYVLGRDGRVRASNLGFHKRDADTLEAAVRAALDEGAK
jgi:thiol-disulfide isomerase/thioredoxin